MSFIAEIKVTSPIMRATRDEVPNMVLTTEDIHFGDEVRFVFWASGDDYDRFESALLDDASVLDYTLLTEVGDRRLYRVTFSEEVKQQMTFPTATKYDIVFLDITTIHDGTQIRARVPTREALRAYREACVEQGVSFELKRLYQEEADDSIDQFGLTPAQRDVLVRAHEHGYYNIPRGVTLEELAEEFDITPSALGRRMRRAEDALIERALRSRD